MYFFLKVSLPTLITCEFMPSLADYPQYFLLQSLTANENYEVQHYESKTGLEKGKQIG